MVTGPDLLNLQLHALHLLHRGHSCESMALNRSVRLLLPEVRKSVGVSAESLRARLD